MSWANALVSVPQNHEIIALDLKSSACWVWMQMPGTLQSLCWGLSMGRARSKGLGVLLGGSPRFSGSLQHDLCRSAVFWSRERQTLSVRLHLHFDVIPKIAKY